MTGKLPAWVQAAVDQRLALLEHAFAEFGVPSVSLLATPLIEQHGSGPDGEPTQVELDYWERSCDNCGHYSKPDEEFYTGRISGTLRDGTPVMMFFGVCKSCKW